MAELQRPIFEIEDPRGYKVVCTRERWVFHVASNRKFMETQFWIDQAQDAIAAPLLIYSDAVHEDRDNYYRLLPPRKGHQSYIKVVVEVDREKRLGVVITAQPADSPKRKEILIWPSQDDSLKPKN